MNVFILSIILSYFALCSASTCQDIPISVSNVTYCTDSVCAYSQLASSILNLAEGSGECFNFISPKNSSNNLKVNISVVDTTSTYDLLRCYYSDNVHVKVNCYCHCDGGVSIPATCDSCPASPTNAGAELCFNDATSGVGCIRQGEFCCRAGFSAIKRYRICEIGDNQVRSNIRITDDKGGSHTFKIDQSSIEQDYSNYNVTLTRMSTPKKLQGMLVQDLVKNTHEVLPFGSVNTINETDYNKIGFIKVTDSIFVDRKILSQIRVTADNCGQDQFSIIKPRDFADGGLNIPFDGLTGFNSLGWFINLGIDADHNDVSNWRYSQSALFFARTNVLSTSRISCLNGTYSSNATAVFISPDLGSFYYSPVIFKMTMEDGDTCFAVGTFTDSSGEMLLESNMIFYQFPLLDKSPYFVSSSDVVDVFRDKQLNLTKVPDYPDAYFCSFPLEPVYNMSGFFCTSPILQTVKRNEPNVIADTYEVDDEAIAILSIYYRNFEVQFDSNSVIPKIITAIQSESNLLLEAMTMLSQGNCFVRSEPQIFPIKTIFLSTVAIKNTIRINADNFTGDVSITIVCGKYNDNATVHFNLAPAQGLSNLGEKVVVAVKSIFSKISSEVFIPVVISLAATLISVVIYAILRSKPKPYKYKYN